MIELLLIIFIFLLIFRGGRISSIGRSGEREVARRLSRLNKEEYYIFNDILIPNGNRTAQLDHVVISKYGVFIIETKNYIGWITGKEMGDYWTQNIYGHKHQLRNPIRQNYGHEIALEKLLSTFGNIRMIPVVVFTQRASLKVKIQRSNVMYTSELVEFIRSYQLKTIPESKVKAIVSKLENTNVTDKGSRRQHVKDIQTDIKMREQILRSGKCPRCGNSLVLRHGKYGDFWGCSNYPKCRFTIKQ